MYHINLLVFCQEYHSLIYLFILFIFIYLPFAIENYMNRSKKKAKNYLDSHGEEAQKKLAGL